MERKYLAFCATQSINITDGVIKIPKTKRFIQYIPTSNDELIQALMNFEHFYSQAIAIKHTFGLDRSDELVFVKTTAHNVIHTEDDDHIDTEYDDVLNDLYKLYKDIQYSKVYKNMISDTISMIHWINQRRPLVIFDLVDGKGNNKIPEEGKDFIL